MSVPHTVLHLLEIMQSLLLLSSGPPFPSLWSAATTLPSARENPASPSALSLIWFLGSGPALVRTTASEPSAVLEAAFPFSHLQPQSASPHLVRSACCTFSLRTEASDGGGGGRMGQADPGGSDLESSGIVTGVFVRVQAKPCNKETQRYSGFISLSGNSPDVTWSNSVGLCR